MPIVRATVPHHERLRLSPPRPVSTTADEDGFWHAVGNIGGVTLAWVYPSGNPIHAHQARTWLSAHLTAVWHDPEAVFTAEIAASEIFTNASLHGGGTVTVAVRADSDLLLLEVGDDCPYLPRRKTAEDDDEGGRGLQIVDALATRWRVVPRLVGGKTVQVVLPSGSVLPAS